MKKNKMKNKMNTIKDSWNVLLWYEKIEWMVLLFIGGFSFLTMCYDDMIYTSVHSYHILRCIILGEVEGLYLLFSSNYGFTLFLIYMIWNIPILFVELLTEGVFYKDIVGALLWDKLLLIVFTLFLIKAMKRILRYYEIDKRKDVFLTFLVMSSACYLIPVIQVSQYDIIGITFAVWGIVYYLEGNMSKFLLLFAIANPMKYLTILIFVPLVLIKEKKLIKIAIQYVIGFSLIIFNVIMRKVFTGVWGQSYNAGIVENLLGNSSENVANIQTNTDAVTETITQSTTILYTENLQEFFGKTVSEVSIFMLLFALICILCYNLKYEEKSKWIIYIPFAAFASLLLFFDFTAYRIIILCPFMLLLIFINKRSFNLGIMLEMILGMAFIFVKTYESAWLIGGMNTFEYLILKGKTVGTNLSTILFNVFGLDHFLTIGYTAVVAATIGLIFLYYPRKIIVEHMIQDEEEQVEVLLPIIRILFLLIWTALTVYALLV